SIRYKIRSKARCDTVGRPALRYSRHAPYQLAGVRPLTRQRRVSDFMAGRYNFKIQSPPDDSNLGDSRTAWAGLAGAELLDRGGGRAADRAVAACHRCARAPVRHSAYLTSHNGPSERMRSWPAAFRVEVLHLPHDAQPCRGQVDESRAAN